MLHTAFDPASGRCLVEFRLLPEAGVERAWLAGDFNDWSTSATPMVRREDGSLSVTLSLEPGRSHRFRYYFGDGRWENDWAADAYVDNHHGGADSVVVTPSPPGASPPPPITEAAEVRPPEPAAEAPAGAAGGGHEPAGTPLRGRSGYLVVSRWRRLAAMGLLLAGGAIVLQGRHRVVRRRRQ